MRPLILLSNDDGFQAKGINELIDMLSPIADLLVVAPDGPRSGMACAITAHDPLHYKVITVKPGLRICSCNGTPVDCVKIGLEVVADRRPDMVVSGVNHGDNSSVNVHYSGTMGAVLEGCMKGIPSIGFSLCNFDSDADFSPLYKYVRSIVLRVLRTGLPEWTCLNVNFPATSFYNGLKICKMSHGIWSNEWHESVHPHGSKYYWLTGKFTNARPDDELTDTWALEHNYVSVTPIKIDMTDYELIAGLKDLEVL